MMFSSEIPSVTDIRFTFYIAYFMQTLNILKSKVNFRSIFSGTSAIPQIAKLLKFLIPLSRMQN